MQRETGSVQAVEPDLPWQAAYVEKLLEVEAMETLTSRVSIALLHATATTVSRLSAVTAKIKLELEIQRLEVKMGIEQTWKEGGEEFEAAFRALCRHKRLQLQKKIAELVQYLLGIEAIFEMISTRRGDTKKLQRNKEGQRQKIRVAGQQWFDWGQLHDGLQLGVKLPSHYESGMLQGQYPWQSDKAEGAFCGIFCCML